MATNFFNLKDARKIDSPGDVVRAFRKNFGFTLADIERLTGINEPDLSAIENGAESLGPDRAEWIAAVFGIHPSILLRRS